MIIDDDGWEPDEDFYVELYDARTGNRLIGEDTRTRVTILDDDKPGTLVFEEKKTLFSFLDNTAHKNSEMPIYL